MTERVTVGDIEGVYARPAGDGPFPGVVVIHEFWGLNDDIEAWTQRFADAGYAAFAPDLYSWGAPRPLCVVRTATDVMKLGAGTTDRVEVTRTWLAARDEVDGNKIGVIGFCLGARIAIVAATRSPFKAVSVNYGDPPKDTSMLEGICPVVGSYGAKDKRLRAVPDKLREALTSFGVEHDIVQYPDAGHSFMNKGGPKMFERGQYAYVEEADADAWLRIQSWFDKHVKGSA